MADTDAAERDLIRHRLAQSREELRLLFDPPPAQDDGNTGSGNGHMGFPRSRTMQMLLSGRGLGTLGALAGGLLIARPGLALRLLRFIPASAVAKMLAAKALNALKAKPHNPAP